MMLQYERVIARRMRGHLGALVSHLGPHGVSFARGTERAPRHDQGGCNMAPRWAHNCAPLAAPKVVPRLRRGNPARAAIWPSNGALVVATRRRAGSRARPGAGAAEDRHEWNDRGDEASIEDRVKSIE
eukprot:3619004-Pyramimonas_sp.AAC.1